MNVEPWSETNHYLTYEVLGPAFLAFVRILLDSAESDRITKLMFIARDGEFLMRVTEAAIQGGMVQSFPKHGYLHLSRISSALPGEARFDFNSVRKVIQVRAGTPTVDSLLAYYGLDPLAYAELLAKHGLSRDNPLIPDRVNSLLADLAFQDIVNSDRNTQRSLLQAYLTQQGVLGQPGVALVDIGWRGAICAALLSAFNGAPLATPLHAYFLSYWHESGCLDLPGMVVRGLLADHRRSRSPLEGAARYLAYPLEALCRADHGSVTGYQRNSVGIIEPIFTTAIDAAPNSRREVIRSGILDYVRTHASTTHTMSADQLRRKVRTRMFRLAFFPRPDEIAFLGNLVHSEGHVSGWHRRLIDPQPASPWRHPRRWLAGLASPWRAGYVMASGGRFLATFFLAIESALLYLPTSWRPTLQEWARRRARLR